VTTTNDKMLATMRRPVPWQRVRRCALVAVADLLAGCTDPPPRTGEVGDALIYGDDTRRDVYAAGGLGRIALQSTIAFVSPEHLMRDPAGRFSIVADTLGASNNLCPGEAFFAQPAAATCSGVLVDEQLVMTAGHCVRDDATCDDRLLVFDYAVTDPERAIAVDGDAIYACKSVVVRVLGVDATGRHLDFAFIELDRPVTAERRPVTPGLAALRPSSAVTVIGYPSGLPVKVDAGAHVLYDRPCGDYFTIDSDTFEASSGSGVFDELGLLSGLFVRGGADYRFVPERQCAVPRQIAEVGDPRGAEQASYLGPAIAALCASGRRSARLCSAVAVRVPDAVRREGGCAADTEDPGGCTAAGSRDGWGSSVAAIALVAILWVLRARRNAVG
jgi:hypothetical protein